MIREQCSKTQPMIVRLQTLGHMYTNVCIYIYTVYLCMYRLYICIYSILCISTSNLHNLHNLPSEAMTSSLKLPKFHSFRDSMRGRRDEGGNWSGDS